MARLTRFLTLGFVFAVVCSIVPPTLAIADWEAQGIPVCPTMGSQNLGVVVSDGVGGGIVAWKDVRSSVDSDVYVQRVDGAGNMLWGPLALPICTATFNQVDIDIASDGIGGAIIVWRDPRAGNTDIYAQRVDASGNVVWSANGLGVCTDVSSQYYPSVVSDGAGGAIIIWQDYRGGNSDIYAQRIRASGSAAWTANGVALCTATGHQYSPQAISDGAGGAIVAWEDFRSGIDFDIYAQQVAGSGSVGWAANGAAVCTTVNYQYTPRLTSDGYEGAIITWVDYRNGTHYDLYAQRLDQYGNMLWMVNGRDVCTASGHQSSPEIVSDGAGGAIVAWTDNRSGSYYDIYAQRILPSGAPQWVTDGVVICSASDNQGDPAVVSDGTSGAIIAWEDFRSGTDHDIYAQRVDKWGSTLWVSDGVVICEYEDTQYDVELASDEAEGALAIWSDQRNPSYIHVYAQRVDKNGDWDPSPAISFIRDVRNDQGGFVALAWEGSNCDNEAQETLSHYSIWRALPEDAVASLGGSVEPVSMPDVSEDFNSSAFRVTTFGVTQQYWELVGTVDAHRFDSYSYTAQTLFDSTSASGAFHAFVVSAHTDDPYLYWDSAPDSGYSVDNLSPDPPEGLAGDYSYPPAELLITWEPNTEADLSHYAVYKGDNERFVPDESNRLGTPEDTLFVDSSFGPSVDNYYKVSAWDIHENESEYSLLRPEEITGVSNAPVAPVVTHLEQNVPNPFNPVTVIRFSVAEAGMVKLVVYDVAGRPVRALAQGRRGAERYEVTWDGRDDAGSTVASGVYLYQLEAPGYLESKKMVLLR